MSAQRARRNRAINAGGGRSITRMWNAGGYSVCTFWEGFDIDFAIRLIRAMRSKRGFW